MLSIQKGFSWRGPVNRQPQRKSGCRQSSCTDGRHKQMWAKSLVNFHLQLCGKYLCWWLNVFGFLALNHSREENIFKCYAFRETGVNFSQFWAHQLSCITIKDNFLKIKGTLVTIRASSMVPEQMAWQPGVWVIEILYLFPIMKI